LFVRMGRPNKQALDTKQLGSDQHRASNEAFGSFIEASLLPC